MRRGAADFETVMRGIMAEYDAALALRIPTLHFWAPHCVRPGIEAADYPNSIPAVFNYYSVGTAREKAEKKAESRRHRVAALAARYRHPAGTELAAPFLAAVPACDGHGP